MKKKFVMALLVGTLAAAAPVSCFAADTSAETTADADAAEETEEAAEETSDETSEEAEDLKTVGEETEDAIRFKLKNATTKKITGLAIKTSEDAEFPENMMAADDSFALKEKKMVFFTKAEDAASTGATEETSEDQAPTYDLHLTFEDQTTADVHGVALEDLVTLVIREKNGIVYGTYQKQSDKEKASTYDTEKALADQAEADAAAAAQQSQSSDYSYDYSDDYSYDYGGDNYSGGDDYSGGDNGGDGCLDDGLLG